MKKMIALVMIIGLAIVSTTAFAADKLINEKIVAVTEKTDKNGNPYMILSFEIDKKLGTIDYKERKNIMVFSDKVDLVKKLGVKSGTQFKAVCAETEYKGRTGYNLVAIDSSMASTATATPVSATATPVAAAAQPAAANPATNK